MSSSKWNRIIVSIIAIAILVPGMAETQRPKRKGPAPASKTVKLDTLLKKDSTKK
jgi:hypothetical protein